MTGKVVDLDPGKRHRLERLVRDLADPLEEVRVVVAVLRGGRSGVVLAELDFGDGFGRGSVFDFVREVEAARPPVLRPGEELEVRELGLAVDEVLRRSVAMELEDDEG